MNWRRVAGPLGLAGIVMVAGGCASYESRPLDLDAHLERFEARSPADDSVAAYLDRLRAEGRAAPAFDPADGLGVSEAEAVALVFNADLRLARLRAGVTAASADKAGLWEDPVFGADLTRITESVAHPWKTFLSVGFTLPISGRLAIEKQRAGAEARAELERVHQAEWDVRVELRRRWIAWTSAARKCDVMSDVLSRLADVVEIVNANERAAEIPRIEARLFRLELASRTNLLHRYEADRDRALLSVKQAMGLSPSASIELVAAEAMPPQLRGADEVRLAIESGSSPLLTTARAAYEVAERRLELEVRQQYPDIVVGPGYGREDGQDQILLGLSMPLPVFNRNQQAIAVATAEREVARTVFEAELERLSAELAHVEVLLRAAIRERETLEREVVPMVDEQYADARKVASLGEVNTLVMLETLTRQQEAKLALIDAIGAESLALIELDSLAGPERAGDELGGDER